MAPSCSIMPIMSQLAEFSTILPWAMRLMVIPVQLSSLFVGSTPMNVPLCVPLEVHFSITQMMDRYSHLVEDMSGDAVEGLDESFG
ncbi:MAG TPA: hypothetical protein VE568_08930 [Rubrobacter sp.]|jgi:hypothetical protein|nr:hypothetical protein [Rubrobacter sp.]